MGIIQLLKQFKKNRRGIATIWVTCLIAIFSFSIMYGLTYDIVNHHLMGSVANIAPAETPQEYYDNLARFRLLYDALPFVFVFSLLFYAFVQAQKDKYYGG